MTREQRLKLIRATGETIRITTSNPVSGRRISPLGAWPEDDPTTRYATHAELRALPGCDIDAIHRKHKAKVRLPRR